MGNNEKLFFQLDLSALPGSVLKDNYELYASTVHGKETKTIDRAQENEVAQ